ncbi:MAG: hypothetical protein KGZ43_07525 [Sulfuritalea sp.]|nr:hypothetical protein [Sulfuritalea sp.]
MRRKGLALSKGGPMDTVTVDLGKRGGRIDVAGVRDPATGQRFAPDPGFDHNPSAAWSLDVELARRVATIRSPEIRAQTWQALNNSSARKTAWLETVDSVLASRGQDVRRAGHDGFVLGFVDDEIADFARRMAPTKDPVRVVAMSEQGLLHADTGKHLDEGIALTRDQYAMLPNVVAAPDEVYWDSDHPKNRS